MSILSVITYCMKLPNKKALFQLNRVNMRDTLVYLFILFFLTFSPNVINAMLNFDPVEASLSYSQYVMQVIIFYPFLIMFLVISGVSLLAFGAWVIKWAMKRKLVYQQLWKMTGFALLLPLFIYQLIFWAPIHNIFAYTISLIWLYALIYQMVLVYPAVQRK
ncbi:hypothetical protein [Gracilibacillus sp. YIM 98692]|uniref:hypothetical protein n=1 Tax=Gracilibacillus sp. YIM 98692 TaxID=2663532 RepID=UPI0013D54386|nr:hypothetical protein [Gracilibacillus sp. YIM 98692]